LWKALCFKASKAVPAGEEGLYTFNADQWMWQSGSSVCQASYQYLLFDWKGCGSYPKRIVSGILKG